jgi:hypothetical protein
MSMKLSMILVAFGAIVGLGGCASHTHQLVSQDGTETVIGSFTHEGQAPPTMSIHVNDKIYEAKGFAIRRDENLSELKRRYGFSSKHYQQISAGMDTDHRYYSTDPILHSLDGDRVKCSLSWRSGLLPKGTCEKSNGKIVTLVAK